MLCRWLHKAERYNIWGCIVATLLGNHASSDYIRQLGLWLLAKISVYIVNGYYRSSLPFSLCEMLGRVTGRRGMKCQSKYRKASWESKRQGRTICSSYLPTCSQLTVGAGCSVGHNLLSVINSCSSFQIGAVITYLYCRDAWRGS